MDELTEILKLALVGLVAGMFSTYLSGRDHRDKKWWELRASAYQSVIEALSDLSYYYDRHLTAEIEYREFSAEYKEKLKAFWEEAYPKVRKAADMGAFLFSEEANAALNEFIEQQESGHETYIEHLDSSYAGAKKCLKRLVACSKKDLEIRNGWL
ncbi:MAG: hypothetical protein OEV64_15695 [Desulfobulbaceae bacterium]|nr:hypothetical protein [Desulfobulbaceae bacterium]